MTRAGCGYCRNDADKSELEGCSRCYYADWSSITNPESTHHFFHRCPFYCANHGGKNAGPCPFERTFADAHSVSHSPKSKEGQNRSCNSTRMYSRQERGAIHEDGGNGSAREKSLTSWLTAGTTPLTTTTAATLDLVNHEPDYLLKRRYALHRERWDQSCRFSL